MCSEYGCFLAVRTFISVEKQTRQACNFKYFWDYYKIHDVFKELKKWWFSASCKHLSLMNLNNFNSTFSVSQKLFLKNLFVIFGLTSIFCATVIFTITLKPKTLLLSFVSYKFIVLSFFSCKIILHNLWTESLQHFFFFCKSLPKTLKKLKPNQCIAQKTVLKTPDFGSTVGLLYLMDSIIY